MRSYFVYILANRSRRLYIGVTSNLLVRLHQHRSGQYRCFTRDFRITFLVYFEQTANVAAAIAREKQLKRWPRWRKLRLIEQGNSGWRDLGADWFAEPGMPFDHTAPGNP
jgi:putative endonuclease